MNSVFSETGYGRKQGHEGLHCSGKWKPHRPEMARYLPRRKRPEAKIDKDQLCQKAKELRKDEHRTTQNPVVQQGGPLTVLKGSCAPDTLLTALCFCLVRASRLSVTLHSAPDKLTQTDVSRYLYDSPPLNLNGVAVFPSYLNKTTSSFVIPSFLLMGLLKVQIKSKCLSFKPEEKYNIYPKGTFYKRSTIQNKYLEVTLEEGQGLG